MNLMTVIIALLCCLSINAAAVDVDLPPAGRSRFDSLLGNAPVPYPLSRLIAHIRSQLEASDDGLSPVKITLIPLGRSLRRSVAAPDFFQYPSVVAAVDGDSKAGNTPLRDQLFLGYNERAESVEIISYNEQAGRFEFQVIHDYRAGAQPKIVYANRSLCMACHQNNAPIFSRPLWDETPANPAIASRLKATGRDFYGIPISGTDISSAIDASIARANMFQVWQQIWREACSNDCRAKWLAAALAYAMSGHLPEADEFKFADLETRWITIWPQGLSIPASSIPNHNPFSMAVEPTAGSHTTLPAALPELAKLAYIPAQFEPLTPRPSQLRWVTPDTTQLVSGLAGLLNSADVQAFDRALAMHAKAQPQTLTLPCRYTRKPGRVVFDCVTSEAQLSGVFQNSGSTQIDRLQVGQAKTALDLALSGHMTKRGLLELIPKHGAGWVRLSDGRRWSRLQLNTLSADQGSATLTLIDDYAAVRTVLHSLPLITANVFDGSRAFDELQTALILRQHKISGHKISGHKISVREKLAGKLPSAATN